MHEIISTFAPEAVHWLVLSSALFAIGIYGVLTRVNAIGILLSAELTLNAAILNFIIFNRTMAPRTVDGELMGVFVIAVAAAEAVVGMAIFVAVFKHKRSVDVTINDTLKG